MEHIDGHTIEIMEYVRFTKSCTCYIKTEDDKQLPLKVNEGTEAQLISRETEDWWIVCKVNETQAIFAPPHSLVVYTDDADNKTVIEVDGGIDGDGDCLSSSSQDDVLTTDKKTNVSTINVNMNYSKEDSKSEPLYINMDFKNSGVKGSTIIPVGSGKSKPPIPAPRPKPGCKTPETSPANTLERSVTSDYGSSVESRSTSSSPAKLLDEEEPAYINIPDLADSRQSSVKRKGRAPLPPKVSSVTISDNTPSVKLYQSSSNPPPPPVNTFGVHKRIDISLSSMNYDNNFYQEGDDKHSKTVQVDPILPAGWTRKTQEDITYFVHPSVEGRWRCSQDKDGNTYYYNSDSADQPTQWSLPSSVDQNGIEIIKRGSYSSLNLKSTSRGSVHQPVLPVMSNSLIRQAQCLTSDSKANTSEPKTPESPKICFLTPIPRRSHTTNLHRAKTFLPRSREFIKDDMKDSRSSRTRSAFYPRLSQVRLKTKSGSLNKAKIQDSNGKKIKKVWTSSFAVISGTMLLFYKEKKNTTSPTGGQKGKLEHEVELCNAEVRLDQEKSSVTSRKNIITINSNESGTYLLQPDITEINEWHEIILEKSKLLDKIAPNEELLAKYGALSTSLENLSNAGQSPVPDKKLKKKKSDLKETAPLVDRHHSVVDEKGYSKMRDWLNKFMGTRPSVEQMKKRGLIKERPIFGSTISKICEREGSTIPSFVTNCIAAIEKKGLDHDGIYRLSGNQADIQKIRCQIDQQQNILLDDVSDVNVLTGSLKLFFRELEEPLIPYDIFDELTVILQNPNKNEQIVEIRKCLKKIPKDNRETLHLLIKHLVRVLDKKEKNRMQSQNLAIVFGPNLMWKKEETNITMSMSCANSIIDFILIEYSNLFSN